MWLSQAHKQRFVCENPYVMSKQEVRRNSFPNVSVSIFTVPSSREWAAVLVPKSFFSRKYKWGCGRSHIHLLLVTVFLVHGYHILLEKTELLLCLSDVGKTSSIYMTQIQAQTWCLIYWWVGIGFQSLDESPFEGICLSLLNFRRKCSTVPSSVPLIWDP